MVPGGQHVCSACWGVAWCCSALVLDGATRGSCSNTSQRASSQQDGLMAEGSSRAVIIRSMLHESAQTAFHGRTRTVGNATKHLHHHAEAKCVLNNGQHTAPMTIEAPNAKTSRTFQMQARTATIQCPTCLHAAMRQRGPSTQPAPIPTHQEQQHSAPAPSSAHMHMLESRAIQCYTVPSCHLCITVRLISVPAPHRCCW